MFEKSLSNTLQHWYEENKRPLPWRASPKPYSTWISEIILQQTRISQGIGYYHRFLENFPNVDSLAMASEDELLKVWEGLGYYSRARNLHKAAKVIVTEWNGQLPTSYDELLTLPGIGPYTAAAISSICFDEPRPVVDGNVNRVISRLFGISDPVNTPKGHRMIFSIAEKMMNQDDPGTFNQALMEFGALQCTPGIPDCDSCPVVADCNAFKTSRIQDLPVKNKKAPLKKEVLHFLVMKNPEGRILVEKRLGDGIWKGLYQFPLIDADPQGGTGTVREDLPNDLQRIGKVEQKLSHKDLKMHFWLGKTPQPADGQWVHPQDLESLPFPARIRDFIHTNILPLLL